MQFRKAWPRPRLQTRLALTILSAIIAVAALYAVLFLLMPARLLAMYSAHWLVGKAVEATLVIFKENPPARDARAARFGADNRLKICWRRNWDAAKPEPGKGQRPFVERARATIERDLAGKVRKVAVRGVLELRGNMFHVDVQPHPSDFLNRLPLGPLGSGEADLPILGIFEFAIQGLDGSWIIIEPEDTKSYAERLQPWLILLGGAVGLVSILSTITARRALRPLKRLAESARNFGRTRKAVPIDPAGLNEFEVIARAMNEMQERIKSFIDERTHMLAALSHDLRTSLTGLLFDAEELTGGDSKDRLIAGMEDMERVISLQPWSLQATISRASPHK